MRCDVIILSLEQLASLETQYQLLDSQHDDRSVTLVASCDVFTNVSFRAEFHLVRPG